MTVSRLTKVKYQLPIDKHSGIVYEIPCTCGKVYVGETIRRLGTCKNQGAQRSMPELLIGQVSNCRACLDRAPSYHTTFQNPEEHKYFHTLVHFFKCLFRLHVLRVCLCMHNNSGRACISIHKYGLGVPCMEISNLPIWPLKVTV